MVQYNKNYGFELCGKTLRFLLVSNRIFTKLFPDSKQVEESYVRDVGHIFYVKENDERSYYSVDLCLVTSLVIVQSRYLHGRGSVKYDIRSYETNFIHSLRIVKGKCINGLNITLYSASNAVLSVNDSYPKKFLQRYLQHLQIEVSKETKKLFLQTHDFGGCYYIETVKKDTTLKYHREMNEMINGYLKPLFDSDLSEINIFDLSHCNFFSLWEYLP